MRDPYKRKTIGGKNLGEHRYLMEQHLGRKLLRCEFVHHINGDKKDNRLENLEVVHAHEHAIMHNQKYPVSKMCLVCGKEFWPSKTKRSRTKACSPNCIHELEIQRGIDRRKTVVQIDLCGNIVRVWNGVSNITKELGFYDSNISKCAHGKIPTAYGFKWQYEEVNPNGTETPRADSIRGA